MTLGIVGQVEDEVREIITPAVEQGLAMMRDAAIKGLPLVMYLYYRPAEGMRPGMFQFVMDDEAAPPDFKLVTGEGIRGGLPYDHYYSWVRQRVGNLPILAVNKSLLSKHGVGCDISKMLMLVDAGKNTFGMVLYGNMRALKALWLQADIVDQIIAVRHYYEKQVMTAERRNRPAGDLIDATGSIFTIQQPLAALSKSDFADLIKFSGALSGIESICALDLVLPQIPPLMTMVDLNAGESEHFISALERGNFCIESITENLIPMLTRASMEPAPCGEPTFC